MAKYLIDSNVFIQAKNMYYRFDFCGGFWDWVKTAHDAGILFSVKKVKAELLTGKDSCADWVKALPNEFFVEDSGDIRAMQEYGRIIRWAFASDFRDIAKEEFAREEVADAFLIAVAKAHNYIIVTQEQSNPVSRRKILLPDAAAVHGVKTMYVYDMLSQLTESTFVHRPMMHGT